ncbi:MAG: hypothetical protein DRJ51_09115 [Thermoprotei archaeon]|nr:MAG: hypothetical protein DRJ51_09115 [Thermoprotei archaeon]
MVGPTQSIRLSTLNAVEWWAERSRFLLPFRRAHGDLRFFWWATTVDGGGGVRELSLPGSGHHPETRNIAELPTLQPKGA